MVRQGHGEFGIGDGIGDDIDCAPNLMLVHAELDDFNKSRKRNPTHPLATAAQIATQSQAKQGKHFCQRSSLAGKYHAKTKVNNADSKVTGRIGCRFPLAADVGEESIASNRIFGENFFAAITIETDGGGAEQYLWTMIQAR